MKPSHITFTGLDEATDLEKVVALSKMENCEWGILFSRNRQGIDPRYPSMEVIEKLLDAELTFAAHLCGKIAQQVMETSRIDIDLSKFNRVQVNHIAPSAAALARFSDNIGLPVIGQWRDSNRFPEIYEGVSWLYDPSGGNGFLPTVWPENPSEHPVGYAGGINADNVATVIAAIGSLSPAGYWIDMESGVRTENLLDLRKVQAVIENVALSETHC